MDPLIAIITWTVRKLRKNDVEEISMTPYQRAIHRRMFPKSNKLERRFNIFLIIMTGLMGGLMIWFMVDMIQTQFNPELNETGNRPDSSLLPYNQTDSGDSLESLSLSFTYVILAILGFGFILIMYHVINHIRTAGGTI